MLSPVDARPAPLLPVRLRRHAALGRERQPRESGCFVEELPELDSALLSMPRIKLALIFCRAELQDLSMGLPVFFVPVFRYFEHRYTGT